ncbi:hypothetical protein HC026_03340 [Lactobacillus sp. LC28-10]|uniref:Uncharacterized protein n=1 Tax=Secundilactobacillus angelensis TaxID=2722706 RepID=A0ABX1KVM3_9LACO|nr:hypothetical protein [Secundilactobacillus angelensis]MCH5461659.1 hypothetical protein [Secundilactobacillus angelensis]NLR17954.1 hypothetical protein [Secundilactobacillus angelensis]
MSPRISRRHTTVVLIVICMSGLFGTSLLTRGRELRSGELMPRTHKMLSNHVTVNYVNRQGHKLRTYYWSTHHATGRNTDVTDIFNSDIINSGSGINRHLPMDYTFDQTDLRNVKTLRNVRLGHSVNLIVTKLKPEERPSGLQRFYKWLINS